MVGDHFAKLEDQLAAMAEGDDRSRAHDDRADAFVWAMIHLSGSGQGNWAMVYGFDDCGSCGARVNTDKDQRCKNCGTEVAKTPPKHPGGRPAREPWSAAYLNTCINEDCGKTYPRHERTCPHCSPEPRLVICARSSPCPGGTAAGSGTAAKTSCGAGGSSSSPSLRS